MSSATYVLVFAPPGSVGKFGGDTDNWMWPRHTGDFSVFRVYANKDNAPANYSKDNVPYKPKYHATVSTEATEKNDYAMTIGFPGSTSRYIPSFAVENRMKDQNDPRIEVRGIKQDIWRAAMMLIRLPASSMPLSTPVAPTIGRTLSG